MPVAGQRAPKIPHISGLEQSINETIVFLLETAPASSSIENDVSSQLGNNFSQQSFQATSSQHTALGSSQQKPSCDAIKASKATLPAGTSAEAPKSNLDLVEQLIDQSARSLQELASYSGQDAALKQVRIAVELPRKVQMAADLKYIKRLDGILLHGPPGTGKTLIAQVLAAEAGITTFNASPSSIMSRYVGDGEK